MTIDQKREVFRDLHRSGFFVLPNAWDLGSARRLEAAGFRAIGSTSSGAAWAAGVQDGDMALEDVLAHLRMLVDATTLPINADFESGFAQNLADLQANIERAAETGVAGISLEDWSGQEMYDSQLACERIRAAREQLDVTAPRVLLIGRNENYRVPSMTVSESNERLVAYSEAGADCLYAPFIDDHGAVAELVAAVAPKPLNVVVTEYDNRITALADLGVRRCSVGGSLAKKAWLAVDRAIEQLQGQETRNSPARPR